MARTRSSRVFVLFVIAAASAVIAAVLWLRHGAPGADRAAGATVPGRGGSLVASMRSEPTRYNRYVDTGPATEVLSLLTHGRLVRINRATDELEPWLAESWTSSSDGLTHTLKLRSGVRFSDGEPFTSADVLFTIRALYDPDVNSSLKTATLPGGRPLDASAPDASTVVLRFALSYAPGLRLLDHLPILPRHKLEAALTEKRFLDAWKVGTSPADIAGLGPFVLKEHVSGQRMVFERNPHYWRRDERGAPLPYLDALTVVFISDQNTESLRMEAGDLDLMANGDIRLEDYAAFKRAADAGRLRLIDVGTSLDPNYLWFNLSPSRAPGKPWLDRREFRQAISFAADRQAIVNAVLLGEGVPMHGPVSPGNRTWYSGATPTYEHNLPKARELLAGIGLVDRNGDGVIEDPAGAPIRFSLLTQRGHTVRERTASMLQEQLRHVGITVDVVALDTGSLRQRIVKGDFETMYYGFQQSSTDPAVSAEFWLSSGSFHAWNPGQRAPATPWEARLDELTLRQMQTLDLEERKRIFAEMQRILGEELPVIAFAVPKVILAVGHRVVNPTPALPIPQLLWSADTLGADAAAHSGT